MRVRVEHLDEPLGIGDREPRLSWCLPAGSTRQLGYEISIDGTPTGRVDSADNVLVPWPGEPLSSRERREVRVRVWTEHGHGAWSEPGFAEAGLLRPDDWRAVWVEPVEHDRYEPGFRPAYLLRGTFEVAAPVVRARLYATARGVYEPYLNGRRVGDHELTPGYTEYGTRIQVHTYDVTALVAVGSNALGVLLADGWYRGQVGMLRSSDQFGDRTAVLAQLHVDHPDGTTTVAGTGAGWTGTRSHILAADLIEGQREDRRLVVSGWSEAGFDDSGWDRVRPATYGYANLVASAAPPVRAVQELRPVAVTAPGRDRQVFDLGQNINGRVRLTDLGPAGTTVTVTHAEALDAAGDVTTEHLRPALPHVDRELRAGMVDRVTSAGLAGDAFEPRFTTHGFRYVRVDGHPDALTVDDLAGVVVHTDLRRTGSFECSDPDVNALHAAAVWSFRGNACDIPTDCPTRERAGWTGDWQVYQPVASFLFDVAGFSVKWLRDLAAGQWDNGIVANTAPMPAAEREGFLKRLNGSAGWGDAAVLVPWELYQEYGDTRVLEEQWPSIVAWLSFVERTAAGQRHPTRRAARPVPAPHERYLWDTGHHWGEWLVPGEDLRDFAAFAAADKADVATAFFARSAGVAARIADTIGRTGECARYDRLRAAVVDAWRAEFLTADGRVRPSTQANLVRALSFRLVPDGARPAAADHLAKLIRDNGTHLATGFLATPDLLPVLADNDHLDLAYDLLRQDTPPSWMTMIRRGATTVWERWDGIDDRGVPHESLNHYSKGAVIGFLHRYVAGLRRTEPTWRTFRVAPMPGGGITWARAEHESPHGRVAVHWRISDGSFALEVTVPPGCDAEVHLPSGPVVAVGPGDHRWSVNHPPVGAPGR